MVCDSFRVRRGDRFCIDDNQAGARQCYYGSNDRTFYFPLNLSSSTNIGNRYSVEMKFRPNKKKNSKGFRFVLLRYILNTIVQFHYLFHIYRCVLSTITSSPPPPSPSTTTISTTQAPPPPPTCIEAGDTCSADASSKDTCCGNASACFETFPTSDSYVCTACIKENEKCETATATNCCKDARFCSTDGAGGFECSKCLKDGDTCTDAADCCRADGRCKVDGGVKKCTACANADETCDDDTDCCTANATCANTGSGLKCSA